MFYSYLESPMCLYWFIYSSLSNFPGPFICLLPFTICDKLGINPTDLKKSPIKLRGQHLFSFVAEFCKTVFDFKIILVISLRRRQTMNNCCFSTYLEVVCTWTLFSSVFPFDSRRARARGRFSFFPTPAHYVSVQYIPAVFISIRARRSLQRK